MQFSRFLSIAALFFISSVGLTSAAVIVPRYTRAKIDQYHEPNCDGKGGNKKNGRVQRMVGPATEQTCVDIDQRAHSIYLSEGRGPNWGHMIAFARPGCQQESYVTQFHEHDSGSACMNIDEHFKNYESTTKSHGRINSVLFSYEPFTFREMWQTQTKVPPL